jgi:hypothetical protein
MTRLLHCDRSSTVEIWNLIIIFGQLGLTIIHSTVSEIFWNVSKINVKRCQMHRFGRRLQKTIGYSSNLEDTAIYREYLISKASPVPVHSDIENRCIWHRFTFILDTFQNISDTVNVAMLTLNVATNAKCRMITWR